MRWSLRIWSGRTLHCGFVIEVCFAKARSIAEGLLPFNGIKAGTFGVFSRHTLRSVAVSARSCA